MSILTVWIKVLCGLDYQHTNHSGVWLMFLDVPKRYKFYHVSGCCPLLYLMYLIHSIIFLCSHILPAFLFFLFHYSLNAAAPESVPLYRQLINKLSITKPQEPQTMRYREDQISNPQATPPHQTSSETAKDTNTVLHQQNAHLQQENARLQQEVTRLKQENIRQQSIQQDHQQEITHLQQHHQQEVAHLQQEITHLQQVTRQLQSRLDQQPKLGSCRY